MKRILTLIVLTLATLGSYATHLAGGEMTYTHISGLDYKITVKLYRDCNGTIAPNSLPIDIKDLVTSTTYSITLAQTASGLVNTYCPNMATSCTSPTSVLNGFEYYVYEAITTLPSTSNFLFTYTLCCRPSGMLNIYNSGSTKLLLYAKLDLLSAVGGFNNAPQFIYGSNNMIYNSNQTYTVNQGGIDSDGDQLVYSLSPIFDSIYNPGSMLVPCTYSSPATWSTPLGTTGSMSINPNTGDLTFSNSIWGKYSVAVKIELQLIFDNLNTNNLPTLSGVNGGASHTTSVNLCAGSSVSFTVNSTDPDVNDTTFINMNPSNIPGSTLTSNGAQQATATFSWTPTAADIRPQPYLLILEVKDNACNTNTYGYLIYVNQCNTDSVWAGDANADFVVNNYDVLNIGIGNGTTGIVRPSATTNWVAEYCPDWTNSFASAINYKHADCNGDGTIDMTDLNAITLNYGQTHLKKENYGVYKAAGLPDLYLDLTGISAIPGSTLQIPVMLGTSTSMMNDIYGIAANLLATNTMASPMSLTYPTSWLGNTNNSMLFQKGITNNKTAFTLVRNNQQDVSGLGQIATLTVNVSSSAVPGSDLVFQFSDIKMIDHNGMEISDYNVLTDSLKIASPNSVDQIDKQGQLDLFPNPVNNELNFILYAKDQGQYTITDLSGRIISTQHWTSNGQSPTQIQVSDLASGMYLIKIDGETIQTVRSFRK